MRGDYVYRNANDTLRVQILKRGREQQGAIWDYLVFFRGSFDIYTFSHEAGEYFRNKREAKAYAEQEYGELTSLGNIRDILEGW